MRSSPASIVGPRPGYGPLPTKQVTRRRSHLSTAQAVILDVLIDQPEPCTVAALSTLIGQHPNTIREHLDKLSNGGLVVRARGPGPGPRRWAVGALPGCTVPRPRSAPTRGLGSMPPSHPCWPHKSSGPGLNRSPTRSRLAGFGVMSWRGGPSSARVRYLAQRCQRARWPSVASWSPCLTGSGSPRVSMSGSAWSSFADVRCWRQPIGAHKWCAQCISVLFAVRSTNWVLTLNERKTLHCNRFRSLGPAVWICSLASRLRSNSEIGWDAGATTPPRCPFNDP